MLTQDKMKEWWSHFENSQIDFVHTSGGLAHSNSIYMVTKYDTEKESLIWAFVTSLTQKRIIADTRIGLGGLAENNF